jgi:hypothetical protein
VTTPAVKISVVAVGYVAAIIVAFAAVAIRIAYTSGPDGQAASGMYAFGDALLFIAVFGVTALIPTGAALFFLRPYRAFWHVISGLALAVAVTSIVAAALYASGRDTVAPSPLASWAALSVLRILIAPLLALTFLVSALLSPDRTSRLALLAATVMEAAVGAYAGFVWLVPLLFNK